MKQRDSSHTVERMIDAATTRAVSLHTLSGLTLEGANFTRPKPLLLLAYLALETFTTAKKLREDVSFPVPPVYKERYLNLVETLREKFGGHFEER